MFDSLIESLSQGEDMAWFAGASHTVQVAIIIVGILICIVGVISIISSIVLYVSYVKYNHRKASCGLAGKDVARKILDNNGLQNIAVKSSGSFLFGNSYSHYFHKVRLRRMTWKKDSLTSLAMAAQKSSLAVLDKEGDGDMKARVRLTPFIYFGPIMCIPLIVIGALIDYFFFNFQGTATLVAIIIGLAAYGISFVMSIMVLKTEVKAQQRATVLLKEEGLATDEELTMMKDLFKLYNVQYVIDMIIALLELIMRILQIVAALQGSSSSSSSNN